MPDDVLPGSDPVPARGGANHPGRALPPVFGRYRSEIDVELKSLVDSCGLEQAHGASLLYDMMRYHLGWIDPEGRASAGGGDGKALRPTLCLLACEACGGDYRQALPAAAAIELVHNYSLIHDDIQDDDRERRHRPTVWSIWGKAQAINAGTGMRMLANVAIRRLKVPAYRRERIQRLVDDATMRLIEGQHLDVNWENRVDITCEDYLVMIGAKTAALIKCSLEVGASLATEDEMVISAFGDLGWNLGLAFQARDDILGIWGRQEDTGKISGGDIARGKKTLPIVCAFEKGDDGIRGELVRAYGGGARSAEVVIAVRNALEQVGARDRSQRMTERFTAQAGQAIEVLPMVASAKREFGEIIRFLGDRTF